MAKNAARSPKPNLLSGLNPAQREAVTHGEGPLLVIAGAGTGKTEVITKRIAWLLQEKKAKPEEILGLTFTEKAAYEMLVRVDSLSAYIYPDITITTFHGFGDEILRRHALELGLIPEYRVLSEPEQLLFLRDHLDALNLKHYYYHGDPTAFLRELVKNFSRAKDEVVFPEEYAAAVTKLFKTAKAEERAALEKLKEAAGAYSAYQSLLFQNGVIDYGDQIVLLIKLFRDHPQILDRYRTRFKFILVDEFQDCNYAQSELLKLLAGPRGNVTVVADDDQAIYRFRGAASYNVLRFREEYPKAKEVVLTKNYRSTQPILDAAYTLIQNNNPDRLEVQYGVNKKLTSEEKAGPPPRLMLFESALAEADAVAEKIIELSEGGKKPLSEFAVLVRANRYAAPFLAALRSRGISSVFSGAEGLYEKDEIRILIAFLNALHNPLDNQALYHLLISPVYLADVGEVAKLLEHARRTNRPLSRYLPEAAALQDELGLSEATVTLAERVAEDLTALREESRARTAGQVLKAFLDRSGYLKRLVEEEDQGSVEAAQKIIAITDFFDRIIEFQRTYRDHSVAKFVEYLNLLLEVGEDPRSSAPRLDIEGVQVMTVHKAKGLEFDTVFLVGLSDTHFPPRERADRILLPESLIKEALPVGDAHIEEERRVFYVAMTRARRELYLTAALDYGTKRTHKLSRFVREALPDAAVPAAFAKHQPVETLRHFEVPKEPEGLPFKELGADEPVTVSRQEIDDYLTCPLKYKFIHVVPISVVQDQAVAYGSTVHGAIEWYYLQRKSGASVTLKDLLSVYGERWQNQGFLSPAHEARRFEAGRAALKAFYRRAEKRELPLAVESKFRFEFEGSSVEGRMDVIERVGGKTRIIDFKTSDSVRDQKRADERAKESIQLKIYGYAYFKKHGRLPDELVLHYVDSQLEGVVQPSESLIVETEEVMRRAIAGIRKRDYGATPSYITCGFCPFRFYCPYAILEKIPS